MNVTNEWLREHNACTDGYCWAQTQYNREFGALVRACAAEHFAWAVWVISRRATKMQNVQFAIYCAELALPVFQSADPNDDRPRKAIEAAKAWLADPSEKNRVAAYAAYAAYAAAADAAYAAYAAADAAYAAAAYAAAAYAAYAAADSRTEEKIIKYGISLFKDGAK